MFAELVQSERKIAGARPHVRHPQEQDVAGRKALEVVTPLVDLVVGVV